MRILILKSSSLGNIVHTLLAALTEALQQLPPQRVPEALQQLVPETAQST